MGVVRGVSVTDQRRTVRSLLQSGGESLNLDVMTSSVRLQPRQHKSSRYGNARERAWTEDADGVGVRFVQPNRFQSCQRSKKKIKRIIFIILKGAPYLAEVILLTERFIKSVEKVQTR